MAGSYDPVSTFLSHVEPWISGTYVNIEAYDWEPKAGGNPGEGDLSRRKGSRACQDIAEAINYIRWQDGQGREVYLRMAAHRQPGIARQDKRGRTYYSALGGKANAVSLKSLYIDVDVKAVGPHHRTVQEAQEAVGAMCTALGLPLPSIVVRSGGGGFHAHWVLTRPMPTADWLVLAQRLQAACKAHGVLADHNLTVNPVCLLRIPGTHNRKYGQPRPVTMDILGPAVDPDVLMRTLEAYADITPQPNFSGGGQPGGVDYQVEFPPDFPVGAAVVLEEKFSAGFSGAPYTLEEIAVGCPLVRETLKSGGKDQPEPLWYGLAGVCVFTEGERADFHRLSKGDSRYDPAATDKKFDQARDEKLKQDLGWPRCKTLSEKLGNTHCASCPHLSHSKSPLNFAVRDTPVITPQGNGESGDYTPATFKVTDVDGYTTDPTNATYSWDKIDKKGNIIEVLLWDYPIWNLDYKRDHHGRYAIHFDTSTGKEEIVHIVMPTSALVDTGTLRRCLVDHYGLGINTDLSGGILNFMTAFQSQMRKTLARVNRQELMGWVEEGGKPTGFIYGPNKYTPVGTTPFYQPDATIKGQYFPTGAIEPWLEAMQMINAEQRPEMDLLVATAFAAPLMKFTGEKGVVISAYSSGTAVHKTSAIKVGQSVWGSFLGINQLTDTLNSVMAKVGLTRITPTYYDEMKSSLDIKYFAKMLYTFTGGRGKGRLNRNAEIKEVDTWDTLLVGVSNDSLFDHIAQMDQTTDAGVARIFEFEVRPPTGTGQLSMGAAGEILKKLESNYGHAGARYAEYLGVHVDTLQKRVTDMVDALQVKLGALGPERFWISAAAVLLLGAQIANDLKLAKFNMASMEAFIAQTFSKMRAVRSTSGLDISKKENIRDTLAAYLNTHRQNILATDTIGQSARGVGILNPVTVLNLGDIQHSRAFTVRYARDPTPTLRISRTALNAWLKEKEAAPGVFMRYLKEHYGATIVPARVTSGTSYAASQERLIVLDLTHPDLIDLYEVS